MTPKVKRSPLEQALHICGGCSTGIDVLKHIRWTREALDKANVENAKLTARLAKLERRAR